MADKPIHVTFGASARVSLRSAFRTLKRYEEILDLEDDLSCGPIDPAEPRLRAAWRAAELDEPDYPPLITGAERFWTRIAAHRGEITAWISRRYATEYCGLLELLSCAHAPVSVIDVADVEFRFPDGRPSPLASTAFSYVGDDYIIRHELLERAVLVSPTARDAYLAEWQTLRVENAALRVMTSTGLVSAPITYFDDTILALVTSDWRVCARVVGDSTAAISPGLFRQGGGDSFVFARLLALIDDGVLEGQTDQERWAMQSSSVRRAQT